MRKLQKNVRMVSVTICVITQKWIEQTMRKSEYNKTKSQGLATHGPQSEFRPRKAEN